VAQVKTLLALAIPDVSGLQTALDAKAALASQALTGNPTAPTPAQGDNDTSIATTAFVQGEKAKSINAQTGTSYTLVLPDAAKFVTMTNAGAVDTDGAAKLVGGVSGGDCDRGRAARRRPGDAHPRLGCDDQRHTRFEGGRAVRHVRAAQDRHRHLTGVRTAGGLMSAAVIAAHYVTAGGGGGPEFTGGTVTESGGYRITRSPHPGR
jgi:hypothetical protein